MKSEESRRKVSNQILCYLCTIKFKRNVHRECKKRALINGLPLLTDSPAKRISLINISAKNDTNSSDAEMQNSSLSDFEPIPGLGNFTGQDLKNTKSTSTDLLPETIEKWREHSSNLRNIIQIKDNIINEKDKHIQSMRTEMLEKEREHLQKTVQAQQNYDTIINESQETINDLKRQLIKTSKLKS